MDDQEFRVYPLADWIRLSRAGVVQTCLQRGRYGTGNGQRGKRWYRMKIHLRHGYPTFNVRDRTGHAAAHALHRAIGLTWLDPPVDPACNRVLHKDDNKLNWNLDNLYWGTDLNNSLDAWRNGKLKPGGENHQAKLSNKQREEARVAHALGESQGSLARRYGVTRACISHIVKGRKSRHRIAIT